MKDYTVYFEFYGRKMKTVVLADSEEDAKEWIRAKINFIKIDIDNSTDWNKASNIMDNIMDILKGKK